MYSFDIKKKKKKLNLVDCFWYARRLKYKSYYNTRFVINFQTLIHEILYVSSIINLLIKYNNFWKTNGLLVSFGRNPQKTIGYNETKEVFVRLEWYRHVNYIYSCVLYFQNSPRRVRVFQTRFPLTLIIYLLYFLSY